MKTRVRESSLWPVMNEAASIRRKRPFAAIAGTDSRGGGDSESSKRDSKSADGVSRHDDVHEINSGAAAVAGKYYDNDGDGGNCITHEDQDESDCSDDGGECQEEVTEIVDLQKALEYLVSERDVEKIYNDNENGDSGRQQKQQQARESEIPTWSKNTSSGSDLICVEKSDEQLFMIPNLINRLLLEHYSANQNLNSASKNKSTSTGSPKGNTKANSMTRIQKEKMTQLIIAVIVEFSEPYFVRKVRHRQQERRTLLMLQQQKQTQEKSNTKVGKESKGSKTPQDGHNLDFDDRAVSWATTCINQLLHQPGSVTTNNKSSDHNGNSDKYDHVGDEEARIPELDALLAASGPHDGMEMERRMQSALLHGLHGRRKLQNMGM